MACGSRSRGRKGGDAGSVCSSAVQRVTKYNCGSDPQHRLERRPSSYDT